MTRFVSVLLTLGLLPLTAIPAQAEDFEFTVPVNFSHLPPDISNFLVDCTALQARYGVPVGDGQARPRMSGGEFHGDVVVRFNATAGHDPAWAHFYQCRVIGFYTDRGASYSFYGTSSPTFPLESGAPMMLDTSIQPLSP
ncbi:MAG TPA: hypothetical protein VMU08_10930 [Rhizomicrobium sp.]|nr:hypothetical protein [Rhizomicrobium sp.]